MARTAALLIVCSLLSFLKPSKGKHEFNAARPLMIDEVTEHGTLVIFGASKTDIILASDSRETVHGAIVDKPKEKFFPVGKLTACGVSGTVALYHQNLNTQIDDKMELYPIVENWTEDPKHKGASESDAFRSVLPLVKAEMKRYYTAHKNDGLTFGDPHRSLEPASMNLVCVGYIGRSPLYSGVLITESLMNPDLDPTGTTHEEEIARGGLIPFGEAQACRQMLNGTDPLFKSYRDNPLVPRYHKWTSNTASPGLSTKELLTLSKLCLSATESEAGRRFDPKAEGVGEPNRYAVISPPPGIGFHRVQTP